MSKIINQRYGVDGIQLFFRQFTNTNENGTVVSYFEFYDENNNAILNTNENNLNIWNMKVHNITSNDEINFNFLELTSIPSNAQKISYKIILNPKQQDVKITVYDIHLSLVADSTKLSTFTTSHSIK